MTPVPTPTRALPTRVPLSAMVERVRPAVVRLSNPGGVGTGVIFRTDARAYVLTNAHVVEGYDYAIATVGDASVNNFGTVLGVDPLRDLAVVRVILAPDRMPPPLPFGDASALRPGDQVVAIGYALDISGPATVTQGIVSAVRYESAAQRWLIQTDAAINPGNSGGPLLNMAGEVVGINTFGIKDTEGLGFAVSAVTVKEQLPSLMTGSPRPTPTLAAPGYLFGPQSGELRHEPDDDYVEADSSWPAVDVRDIEVEATFFNPYVGTFSSGWSYGFFIRYSSSKHLRIIVDSNRNWEVSQRFDWLGGGKVGESALHLGTGQQNHIRFVAQGNQGILYVNGGRVGNVDLSAAMQSGSVRIATGLYVDHERAGAVTRYEGFKGKRP